MRFQVRALIVYSHIDRLQHASKQKISKKTKTKQ